MKYNFLELYYCYHYYFLFTFFIVHWLALGYDWHNFAPLSLQTQLWLVDGWLASSCSILSAPVCLALLQFTTKNYYVIAGRWTCIVKTGNIEHLKLNYKIGQKCVFLHFIGNKKLLLSISWSYCPKCKMFYFVNCQKCHVTKYYRDLRNQEKLFLKQILWTMGPRDNIDTSSLSRMSSESLNIAIDSNSSRGRKRSHADTECTGCFQLNVKL